MAATFPAATLSNWGSLGQGQTCGRWWARSKFLFYLPEKMPERHEKGLGGDKIWRVLTNKSNLKTK